jgi:hypothetical protein
VIRAPRLRKDVDSLETPTAPRANNRAAVKRERLLACSALGLYAPIVVWLTWPLALSLGSRLPDSCISSRFDNLLIAWAASHQVRALLGVETLGNGSMYHPVPQSLFFGEAGFGIVPYFAPVFVASGNPTLSLNAAMLLSISLTSWSLYLVTVWWTGSPVGGFLAGLVFLFTRWTLWTWIPCAANYAVLQYLPFIVYLAGGDLRSVRRCIVLALLVTLQGATSIYVAAAVLCPILALSLYRLSRKGVSEGLRLLGITAVASLALLSIYSGYLRVWRRNPEVLHQTQWSGELLVGLPSGFLSFLSPTAVPAAALAMVAGTLVWMCGRAKSRVVLSEPRWSQPLLWSMTGALLTLTPSIVWNGRVIDLPRHNLAELFPAAAVLRVPFRTGVGALIGMSLLAGVAFADIEGRCGALGRRGRRARWIPGMALFGIVIVMYGEYSGRLLPGVRYGIGSGLFFREYTPSPREVPVQVVVTPVLPRAYPLFAPPGEGDALVGVLREGEGPVLELPVGGQPGGDASTQARAVFRSIFHRRPVLNGYSGYWPRGFPELMAASRRLPDRGAVAALRSSTGLATIVVSLDHLASGERGVWEAVARDPERPDMRLMAQIRDTIVFNVQPAEERESGGERGQGGVGYEHRAGG